MTVTKYIVVQKCIISPNAYDQDTHENLEKEGERER